METKEPQVVSPQAEGEKEEVFDWSQRSMFSFVSIVDRGVQDWFVVLTYLNYIDNIISTPDVLETFVGSIDVIQCYYGYVFLMFLPFF